MSSAKPYVLMTNLWRMYTDSSSDPHSLTCNPGSGMVDFALRLPVRAAGERMLAVYKHSAVFYTWGAGITYCLWTCGASRFPEGRLVRDCLGSMPHLNCITLSWHHNRIYQCATAKGFFKYQLIEPSIVHRSLMNAIKVIVQGYKGKAKEKILG